MKVLGHGTAVQTYAALNSTSSKGSSRANSSDLPCGNVNPSSESAGSVDFSNMTKSQMKKVAQHLYEIGKIDLTQLGMIQMAGPIGKAGPNGEFIPLTQAERVQIDNRPNNYITLVQSALKGIESRHEASDPKSGYGEWKHILAVLEEPLQAMPSVDVKA